ncbi:hypothetical protein QR680_018752 [Steinernema hermaphroditum]|uniref:Uncharacterized protein n=1 Tax=Steinernema hermaphroditum TaxID=289476 RepID=A0AA39LR82_9BILA|nr:hypothetical protein QR680_018752 [Steinernema hermaphroditum]
MEVLPGPSAPSASLEAQLEVEATSEVVGLFRSVLRALRNAHFSSYDRTIVMCSLKCLIGGYFAFDDYAQNARRILGEHHSLSAASKQFTEATLPTLRRKMREGDFLVGDTIVNEEFGVFVHQLNHEGRLVVTLFATGRAECSLGIQEDVHAICQNIIKRAREAEPTVSAPQNRVPDNLHVFRSLLFCLNELSLPTKQVVSMIAHLKCVLVGLLSARRFLETSEALLGNLAFRFPSLKKLTLQYLLDDAIPSLRQAMESGNVVVDDCNLNRELGVFVHAPEEAPVWNTLTLIAGNTELRLGIDTEVRAMVEKLTSPYAERLRTASTSSDSNVPVSGKKRRSAKNDKKPEVIVLEEDDVQVVDTMTRKEPVADPNNNGGPLPVTNNIGGEKREVPAPKNDDIQIIETIKSTPVSDEKDPALEGGDIQVLEVKNNNRSGADSKVGPLPVATNSSLSLSAESSTPRSRYTVPPSYRTLRSMSRKSGSSQESCQPKNDILMNALAEEQRAPVKRKLDSAQNPKSAEPNPSRRSPRFLATGPSAKPRMKRTLKVLTRRMAKEE